MASPHHHRLKTPRHLKTTRVDFRYGRALYAIEEVREEAALKNEAVSTMLALPGQEPPVFTGTLEDYNTLRKKLVGELYEHLQSSNPKASTADIHDTIDMVMDKAAEEHSAKL